MRLSSYIIKKCHNLTHPVLGEVLMLHRVTNKRSRLAANREIEITPAFLEGTIRSYIQRGYRLASIDEVAEIVKAGKTKQKFVCFTLDDGYKDNYTEAYPIFKKYNCPFTINVTTDFIEHKALIWWYVLEDIGVTDEEFDKYRSLTFRLLPSEIEHAFSEWFPDSVYSFNNKVNELALTEGQIVEMVESGLCTIGNHTVSHPNLSVLAKEKQLNEIKGAQVKLERLQGKPIKHFAFPYGYYNDNTVEILGELEYSSAVRTFGGKTRKGTVPYIVNRVELRQPADV